MAYIGLQPQQKTVATSTQQLSGDNATLEFSLNRAVSKAADVLVFVGSSVKIPEVDYTAYDNTILFTSPPASGTDNINISYKAGALSTVYVTANAYPSGTTTAPSIYTIGAPATGIYWPGTTSVGVSVSGNTRLTVIDSPTATSTTTGAVRVAGGMGVTEALYVGGATRLTATTQSTNASTGALVVSGGVGVAKDVSVGGSLNVSGAFTVAGAFNTTSSDSLVIDTAYVFVANTNAGDSIDTGIISKYNDGETRYTGLFRDVTDGRYRLFKNLLVQPSTTVDTGNVSFAYADLVLGNANVTSTTASTTSATGALIVGGGIGAAGTVYVNSRDNTIALGNGGTDGVGNIGASGAAFNYGYINNLVALNTATVGNIQAVQVGNVSTRLTGAIQSPQSSLSVTGTATIGTVNSPSIGNASAQLTGTIQTAAQTNITSVGTLTGLTVAGTTTARAIAAASDNLYDIGASGTRFATVYGVTFSGVSTTAKYADLAEKYSADAAYEPGTVLMFGGNAEVTLADADTKAVAGIVSTNPAYLMNEGLDSTNTVALALTGRVPCRVTGAVNKGDMMVSAGNGFARAETDPKLGTVIGKALENFDGTEGVIEVVVGRI